MCQSIPHTSILACVLDDDGAIHEITVTWDGDGNKFEAIEQEAKERGIRYSDTIMFQFPDQEK